LDLDDFIHYCTKRNIIALSETWAKSQNDFENTFLMVIRPIQYIDQKLTN